MHLLGSPAEAYKQGVADARAEDRTAARTAWSCGYDAGMAEAYAVIGRDLAETGYEAAARQVVDWAAELFPLDLDGER
jgi:hypothetical protein